MSLWIMLHHITEDSMQGYITFTTES